ncbi:MAG: hypothetical protein J5496_07120 [Lachnospiraceae bacterium]|nr:hypothetical protein [Lachnospiraceae bacterium]
MKKFLSVLLVAVMILTLAACGKKEETTEAPTEAPKTTEAPQPTEAPTEKPTEKPVETTPAATEPPVTEPETTAAPTEPETTPSVETTPAPTEPEITEPAAEIDPNAQPEEVFRAMCENLVNVVMAVRHQEADPVQLSFTASGEGKMVITYDMEGMKMDFDLSAAGKANGILDSQKGAHITAGYEVTVGGLLAMMLGSDSGIIADEIEFYEDLETGRSYQKSASEGQWYYTDFTEEEPFETEDPAEYTPDKVFLSYTFSVDGDHYVFEGPINTASMTGTAEDPDLGAAASSPLSGIDLTLNGKLLIDKEMRLVGLTLEAEDVQLDLSEAAGMEGFTASLKGLQAELNVVYEPVDYVLPDEVKDNAVEKPSDLPEDESNPWSDNIFVTDNEILADNELYCLKAVGVEDDWFGLNVSYSFENKSDKNLTVEFKALSVNGYACSLFVYESVKPKETIDFETTLDKDDLLQIGVSSIDEIRVLVSVNDNDKYENISTETYTYYPTGLEADQVVYPERTSNEGEYAVIDTEDVKVYFLGCEYDSFFGFVLMTYIENNSETDLAFDFDKVLINGIEYDTFWRQEMMSGFRGYEKQYFAIESINVEKVETLSAELEIKDNNDFWADPIQTVELNYEP